MIKDKVLRARCVSVNKNNWHVKSENEILTCIINNKYKSSTFPTVGDYVKVEKQEYGYTHLILDIEDRKNAIYRLHNGKNQIMAANIDIVFVMSSMNDDFNISKIERLVIIGLQSNSKVIVVLTKSDLVKDTSHYVKTIKERFPNIDVITVSSVNKANLEKLKGYWEVGQTAVMLGSSGVGKSSLINALNKDNEIKTGEIREKDSKGRHVTTSRSLYTLNDGRIIIDEPGIRTTQFIDSSNYIEEIYKDIEEYSKGCKYKECNHDNAPGCEVDVALKKGLISKEQLNNYFKLKKKENRRRTITGEADLSKRENIENLKKFKKRRR